jgi:hypothetical protein
MIGAPFNGDNKGTGSWPDCRSLPAPAAWPDAPIAAIDCAASDRPFSTSELLCPVQCDRAAAIRMSLAAKAVSLPRMLKEPFTPVLLVQYRN